MNPPIPLVSAIVSTYANERFMAGRLDDLLRQTLGEKLEIIVIDSASPENEGAVVKEYQKTYLNVIYERTDERETVYAAWNRGIRRARGKYITNANTDDRLRPDAYEVMMRALENDPSIALVYADYFITNTENQTFENHIRTGVCLRPDWTPSLMLSGCHMGPQPMWRRNLHDTLGYFNLDLRSAGDYEFWCRVATRFSMHHLNDFLGLYLHNPKGVANTHPETARWESRRIKAMYAARLPESKRPRFVEIYYPDPVKPSQQVNLGLTTRNRPERLKKLIGKLVETSDYPYTLSVVDNGSKNETRDYLKALQRRGVIKNLKLLDQKIRPGTALELVRDLEPEATHFINLNKTKAPKKPGWIKNLLRI